MKSFIRFVDVADADTVVIGAHDRRSVVAGSECAELSGHRITDTAFLWVC